MNEYLFRGKREDNGAWVEGGYHKHIKRQICVTGDKLEPEDICHVIIQSGFADWNMPKPLQAIEVIPETVGMWTGLTDKNGKRVFEGDIVRSDNYIGVVKLGYYTADGVKHIGFYTKWVSGVNYKHIRRDLVYWVQGNNAVVIGNIHDNPELLEGEV